MFGSVFWIAAWSALSPWESHFTQSVVWNPETVNHKTLIKAIMQKTSEGSEFWQKKKKGLAHSTKQHAKPLLNWDLLWYVADSFLFIEHIKNVFLSDVAEHNDHIRWYAQLPSQWLRISFRLWLNMLSYLLGHLLKMVSQGYRLEICLRDSAVMWCEPPEACAE